MMRIESGLHGAVRLPITAMAALLALILLVPACYNMTDEGPLEAVNGGPDSGVGQADGSGLAGGGGSGGTGGAGGADGTAGGEAGGIPDPMDSGVGDGGPFNPGGGTVDGGNTNGGFRGM
jgi:hypothetical protein